MRDSRTVVSDRRRGQSAVLVVVGVVLVAAAGWYVSTLWEENARLRQQTGGQAPARPAAPAASGTASAPSASGPTTGGRSLDEDHAKAMRQVLAGYTGSPKKAWVQFAPADREAAAFGTQLAKIFQEAGWEVKITSVAGMNIKPGIFFFEAEEDPPEFAGTALEAIKAAGLDPLAAAGYRAFYEEKKKENPNWVGIQLEPSQAFALVVGPKPKS